MDKEAQEKIADYLYHHPDLSNTQKGRDILEIVEALGYCKSPICQKCGSPILLSQSVSGLRAHCWCSGTQIDFPIDNRWASPEDGG
ncbi:MAG: hypothetical protein NWE89_14670 [Candidatus Bathyarchaeota archaeon]|nr:hypothetical protein [Candidatus Bathyarchaeota archaeon]